MRRKTVEQRFWEKVEKTTTCWLWRSYKTRTGYGTFCFEGKPKRAHRWSYEQAKGEIPKELQIDHLCRNRACVNPEHLEAVTREENFRRSPFLFQKHCKRGHKFAQEYTTGKYRFCLQCQKKWQSEHADKLRVYNRKSREKNREKINAKKREDYKRRKVIKNFL